MRRKGFTIVELMMVLGIIAVLMTIVVTSVTGSLKRARSERSAAVCTLVEQGFATYHAQDPNGDWPFKVREDETEPYELTGSEIKEAIFQLVKLSKEGNPMMDISGLFVSEHSGERGTKSYGMDFMSAVRGTKGHPQKLSARQLYYGYPDAETGYFRRFKVVYHPTTDRVKVGLQ